MPTDEHHSLSFYTNLFYYSRLNGIAYILRFSQCPYFVKKIIACFYVTDSNSSLFTILSFIDRKGWIIVVNIVIMAKKVIVTRSEFIIMATSKSE